MTGRELIELFGRSERRVHIVGTETDGVIVALDMEGRLFTVINGHVLSKVNPDAIIARSNRDKFQNPGGDALWPAPEGTCFGYEYGTGSWRVPPSVTGAVWEAASQGKNECIVRAEIDLINNLQIGIPCEFERRIRVEQQKGGVLRQSVTETIRYIGKRTLRQDEFLLAPWSLCQLESSVGVIVSMPLPPTAEDIWDMYGSSDDRRGIRGDVYVVSVCTPKRFQLALSERIPWVRYVNEGSGYAVKRFTGKLSASQRRIDIADSPPGDRPSDKGAALSIYCDPTGFVEIEACGGCTDRLESGAELSTEVITEFELI